jgi:hypothetical protein
MNDDPLIGTCLGDYLIEKRIGEGGMGIVYHARQLTLNRGVALKVLPPESCGDVEYVARFLREARAAAQLNHPNIIQVIDAGMSQNFYFMVMEYVEGMNLTQMVRFHGALPEAEALQYMHQAAMGLACAHRNGIIHRDIKPENLIISRSGILKIADLGLAKWEQSAALPSLTATNVIMGSPQYISPEQIRNPRNIDGRSDVYSLGLTAFFLIAGEPPFTAPTAGSLFAQHLTQSIPSIRELCPGVATSTERLLQSMTEKDVKQRTQSMEIVTSEIAAILEKVFAVRVAESPTPIQHFQRTSTRRSFLNRFMGTAVKGMAATIVVLLAILFLALAYRSMNPFAPTKPTDTSRAEPAATVAPAPPPKETVPLPGPAQPAPPPPSQPEPTVAEPSKPPPAPKAEEPTPAPPPVETVPATKPAPAEIVTRTVRHEWRIQGAERIHEWMISQPGALAKNNLDSRMFLTVSGDRDGQCKALVSVSALEKESPLLKDILQKTVPTLTRAVLEIVPCDFGLDNRDLEIEVRRVLLPWDPAGAGWEMAARNTPWNQRGANRFGFDCENSALADINNPGRISFRIGSSEPIQLNVLPELQKMSEQFLQTGKVPAHYGGSSRSNAEPASCVFCPSTAARNAPRD